MVLTISLLHHPGGASPKTRRVVSGSFGIGRGADNDWVLADPDRHLSKRHCMLSWQGEFWQVADLSTNGTFLNGELAPIGPGRVRDLRDGDRLRLGGFEMELRIAEERSGSVPSMQPAGFPLDDSLLGPPLDFKGPIQQDHRAAVEDYIAPPHVVELIDEHWYVDRASPPPPEIAVKPAPERGQTSDTVKRGEAEDLLAAFMRGVGVSAPAPANPVATMEGLGSAFRALVGGLRKTLIARAKVKSEFRIEQTIIRSRGNNPLKFAANDDDALAAIIGTGRETGVTPAAAIAESLRDLQLHEIATTAAMQSAVRSLLREMAPAKLREEGSASALLPSQRKARAWEAYEALHARITQALSDDFDSVFGRAFARAYEQIVREASLQDKAR